MGLVGCLSEIESEVVPILSLIESLVYPMNQEFSNLTINQATHIGLHVFLHQISPAYPMQGLVGLKSGDVVFGAKASSWMGGRIARILPRRCTSFARGLRGGRFCGTHRYLHDSYCEVVLIVINCIKYAL